MNAGSREFTRPREKGRECEREVVRGEADLDITKKVGLSFFFFFLGGSVKILTPK